MNTQRLLPLSGVAFVALVLISAIGFGGDAPGSTDAAADVAAFYDDNTWRQAIGAMLFAASTPFLVLFAVAIAHPMLRERGSPWPYVLIGGSVLTAACLAITASGYFALADGGDNGLSPTAMQAVNVLVNNSWVAWNAGLGVTMLGAAGCLWASGGAERWLGRLALVLGVLLFVLYADFFAMLLTLVWIVVVGLMRSRARRPARVPAPLPAG